ETLRAGRMANFATNPIDFARIFLVLLVTNPGARTRPHSRRGGLFFLGGSEVKRGRFRLARRSGRGDFTRQRRGRQRLAGRKGVFDLKVAASASRSDERLLANR